MTVYVVEDAGMVKIGFTTGDVRQRLSQLQVASSRALRLVDVIDADQGVERALHHELAAHRVRGEWFLDCTPVRDAIAAAKHAVVVARLLDVARFTLTSFEIAVAYLRRGDEALAAAELSRAARVANDAADRLAPTLTTQEGRQS